MQLEKIVFADDITRPDGEMKADKCLDAVWYANALRLYIGSIAPDLKSMALVPSGENQDFRNQFYRSVGALALQPEWLRISVKSPNWRQLALIWDQFGKSLVIGFALPAIMGRAFDSLSIPYLNFDRHPARFIHGPAFCITSNVSSLRDALRAWEISETEIKKRAAVMNIMLPQATPATEHADTALFICQPAWDRSMFANGAPLDVESFAEPIFDLAKRHDRILVFRDGYKERQQLDLLLTQLCPNTALIDGNFYQIINRPDIDAVYSINSPKCLEAGYFGKRGRLLAQDRECISAGQSDSNNYIAIDNPLGFSQFWHAVLGLCGYETRDIELPPVAKLCNMQSVLESDEGIFHTPPKS